MRKIITLEEGLSMLEGGVVKAKMILDGYPTNALFTPEDYMKFYEVDVTFSKLQGQNYSCVYFMCVQHPPHDYSVQLCERYKRGLEDSIHSKVLPSLMDKHDAPLLIELLDMWGKYKVMAKCLGGFFLYLDHHFSDAEKAASLKDVSVCCFRDLVCNKFYQQVQDAAISLISQDRDEKMVDRDLLKNVSFFFLEFGQRGNVFCYDNLEKAILADTANYYSQLASEWFPCYSSDNYFLKVQWCLNQEKARAIQYMYQTTVEKLQEVVHWQLVGQIASKLIEKQKAERTPGSTAYQELLSRCAGLNLGDGNSAS